MAVVRSGYEAGDITVTIKASDSSVPAAVSRLGVN